ncbi:hypothetical protein [Caballeronia sp. NCTM1]|uniref:hypothetical protein n=1 Tax=Caballeronia sp. NCTM1 TaxID=2921753 RepID=UPI002028E899|nr:hypothetical protein [Caballeronia sp. NCTM1]
MKTCDGCKYANWERTKGGRLHPSGDGRCMYEFKLPVLPASMYFFTAPVPSGGFINRRKEFREHCPTYTREAK